MINKEIVEMYLRYLIDIGEIKLGLNESVANYEYLQYHDYTQYIMIECQYIENGRVTAKSVAVDRCGLNGFIQSIRNSKLSDLGIT